MEVLFNVRACYDCLISKTRLQAGFRSERRHENGAEALIANPPHYLRLSNDSIRSVPHNHKRQNDLNNDRDRITRSGSTRFETREVKAETRKTRFSPRCDVSFSHVPSQRTRNAGYSQDYTHKRNHSARHSRVVYGRAVWCSINYGWI